MKDLIKGFKLLSYGLQFKTMIFMFAIFVGLGIFFEVAASAEMGNMGGIYMVLVGSYVFQMVITSTVSSYICSAAIKRKLQTSLPVLMAFILSATMYCVFVAIRLVRVSGMSPEAVKSAFGGILIVGILAGFVEVYNSVAYKFFIPALIFMLFFMIPLIVFSIRGRGLGVISFSNNWMYVIVGLGAIILGAVIAYFLSCACYKRELDPKTYRSALMRAGK